MQSSGTRLLCVRACQRSLSAGSRCKTTGAWDGEGQPPWVPKHLPGAQTFYGVSLTKIQNRELWAKRMEKVNRIWKQQVVEHRRRMERKESQPKPDPPKLWLAVRVKTLGGRPYWEKKVAKQLGLDGDPFLPHIYENKENTNNMLKTIKHLIDLRPVTFPYGLPESEDDYEHCYLRDNGEFVVPKRINPDGEDRFLVSKEDPTTMWDIKQETIDEHLMRKKAKYQINKEFFPSEYIWKRNEDGNEHRYKGNSNVGYAKKWY